MLPLLGRFSVAGFLRLIFGLLTFAGASVEAWNLFTTKRSDVQGSNANPTPAQQINQGVGDLASGAGGLAKGIGDSPIVYLIGGLALLLLVQRR